MHSLGVAAVQFYQHIFMFLLPFICFVRARIRHDHLCKFQLPPICTVKKCKSHKKATIFALNSVKEWQSWPTAITLISHFYDQFLHINFSDKSWSNIINNRALNFSSSKTIYSFRWKKSQLFGPTLPHSNIVYVMQCD